MPQQAAAPEVVAALVDDDGVELIELYRGIGPVTTAQVIDAVGERVPVGSVLYGREALVRITDDDTRVASKTA